MKGEVAPTAELAAVVPLPPLHVPTFAAGASSAAPARAPAAPRDKKKYGGREAKLLEREAATEVAAERRPKRSAAPVWREAVERGEAPATKRQRPQDCD